MFYYKIIFSIKIYYLRILSLHNINCIEIFSSCRLGNLNAMVLARGPPTLFCTFTAAEYRWDDMREYLIQRLILRGVPKEKWEKLSTMELVDQDPVGMCQHFRFRFKKLWDFLLGEIY